MGLLTPVIKGVLTDQGFANTVMAQQMFGGHERQQRTRRKAGIRMRRVVRRPAFPAPSGLLLVTRYIFLQVFCAHRGR
jgi:hypothetical protein